jgi:hypothetical protein
VNHSIIKKNPFLKQTHFSLLFAGKYCGDKFPPIITSSGRSLWLRFSSDKTISYTGFKAVYTFIPNPLGNLPDIGKCTFEAGGFQDFIGTANISQDRIDHSLTYDTPIDCVWTIRAEKDFKIYIQFPVYHLDQPNDCHLNYIQVNLKPYFSLNNFTILLLVNA